MACNLVEGWTERIIYQLFADGVAHSLAGGAVVLQLRTRTGAAVTFAGTADILDAATGKVYFDPASTDLVAANSPYLVRWKFTDSASKVSFFPNAENYEYWVVAAA